MESRCLGLIVHLLYRFPIVCPHLALIWGLIMSQGTLDCPAQSSSINFYYSNLDYTSSLSYLFTSYLDS